MRWEPIIALVVLFSLGGVFPAHTWNDDYQASNTYDSYSQPWQTFKQQNNINTQPVYHQSWWSSTINSISNFLADGGSAINNALNSVGNFFTTVCNNVHDFFIKPPDTNVGAGQAPPVGKDAVLDAGVLNHAPTLDTKQNLSTNISDTAKTDAYKTQTTQKDNPYAYLTAEKACYDPRAAGLPEMSDAYQAIVKEYAARDQWVAEQQGQSEGKLVDSPVGAGLAPSRVQDPGAASQVSTISQPTTIPKNTINQDTVKTITPLQATPAQADIISVGSREVLNAQESHSKDIVSNKFFDFIAVSYNQFNNWDTLNGSRQGFFERRSVTMTSSAVGGVFSVVGLATGATMTATGAGFALPSAGVSLAVAATGTAIGIMSAISLRDNMINFNGALVGNAEYMDYNSFKATLGERVGSALTIMSTGKDIVDSFKKLYTDRALMRLGEKIVTSFNTVININQTQNDVKKYLYFKMEGSNDNK